jgi:scyllo-inositol 2-dehydrogenase (NADP+)
MVGKIPSLGRDGAGAKMLSNVAKTGGRVCGKSLISLGVSSPTISSGRVFTMAKRKKWFSKPGDIKVGVIGYGGAFNMGKAHLTAMKAAGMKPFAVCDVDASRLEVAREDFPGIETYTDLSKMLKQSDVNLIVHITPHNLHYKLAAQCLRAGKHVVTEKPFVLNTAECDRLIKLAEEKKLMLSTYHNRHWDGHIVTAVKKVVEQKVVGDVVAVEAKMGGYGMPKEWWRSSRSVSGGILYDWGCHILEYCLQVIQSDIVEVSGFAVEGFWAEQAPKSHPWKNDMNEDHATAVVRFANGCRLNLTISQIDSDERPVLRELHGHRGQLPDEHGQVEAAQALQDQAWVQGNRRQERQDHACADVLQERRPAHVRQGRPGHHAAMGAASDSRPRSGRAKREGRPGDEGQVCLMRGQTL